MTDREYVGCIHVHTTFSDGHASIEEVIAAGQEADLDYVAVTDHNSDTCRQWGFARRHGHLLCLSAPEIGRRGKPHFLTFGLDDIAPLAQMSAREGIDYARRRGARNFVAHPHPADIPFSLRLPGGWTDWETDAFCGLEIWSYAHDICHRQPPWRWYKLWLSHESLVTGPRPETLAVWDYVCRRRRLAAIGSLDNHAYRLPLLGEMLPHLILFRLMRTHVVCPQWPPDDRAAEKALVDALADGRAFIAMDGWGNAGGFRFEALGADRVLGFGQEAPFAGGWALRVSSPRPAELRILRDGEAVGGVESGATLELPADRPGVYRVEARLSGRPWVYTNPIYLRQEAGRPQG